MFWHLRIRKEDGEVTPVHVEEKIEAGMDDHFVLAL